MDTPSLPPSESRVIGFPARQVSAPLQGTESAANAIQRVTYTHDAMIDLIINNPGISKGQLAKHFGYTQAWVSRVTNSDAFQARLAERKADIVDPSLILSVEERLRGVINESLDIISDKLAETQSLPLAMEALEKASAAAKLYGARNVDSGGNVQVVVVMPPKAQDAASWKAQYAPNPTSPSQGEVIEG